jgi:succinoglycan biosynthesis transport protein ExoP
MLNLRVMGGCATTIANIYIAINTCAGYAARAIGRGSTAATNMLDQLQRNLIPSERPFRSLEGAATTIDLDAVLAGARRQYKMIAGATIAAMLLAILYIIVATPIYTSTADILLDSRQFGATDITRDQASLTFNSTAIESQVEVLKSEKIALAVIEKLNLAADPEFVGENFIGKLISVPFSLIRGRAGDDAADDQLRLQRRALASFEKMIQVKRIEKTFVLNLEFSSDSAAKAATIANAVAEAYLLDHLGAKYDATRRTGLWLQERIEELQRKSSQADMAVERYKEDNKLIGAKGSLVNEQQLAELNSQLTVARAETARSQARYDLIESLISSKRADAAVSEELNNPVMTELRNKYLKVSKRTAELTTRVGPSHEQVALLRNEMQQYEKQIFDELGRIAETYRSDLHIARSREESLTKSLSSLIGASAGDNRTLVSLREKEREAESIRTVYQNFLQRYQEMMQQQSFPITEARLITRATRALRPSKPRKLLISAIGMAGGLCLGIGVAMLREYRDRGVRTSDQVRYDVGLEFLGIIPSIAPDELAAHDESELLRVAVAAPLSKLADTLRTVKVAIDLNPGSGRSHVVGVVSAVAGEGKSTIAANLAMLLGAMGAPTLLVDGDLRLSGLTKAIGIETGRSLADVVPGHAPLSALVRRLPGQQVWFLPCSGSAKTANSSQVLGCARMRDFLRTAGEHFQYIVVDLPPLGALVDGKAIAPCVNSFLFVIEWGKTARSAAQDALAHNEVVNEKCIGAVLNKADPGLLRLYASYGTQGYGYGRH